MGVALPLCEDRWDMLQCHFEPEWSLMKCCFLKTNLKRLQICCISGWPAFLTQRTKVVKLRVDFFFPPSFDWSNIESHLYGPSNYHVQICEFPMWQHHSSLMFDENCWESGVSIFSIFGTNAQMLMFSSKSTETFALRWETLTLQTRPMWITVSSARKILTNTNHLSFVLMA